MWGDIGPIFSKVSPDRIRICLREAEENEHSSRKYNQSLTRLLDRVKIELGFTARYREVTEAGGMYTLQEQSEAYAGNFAGENDALTLDNPILWQKNAESTET